MIVVTFSSVTQGDKLLSICNKIGIIHIQTEATDYNPSIRITSLYDYDHGCTWDISPYQMKFLTLLVSLLKAWKKCLALTLNNTHTHPLLIQVCFIMQQLGAVCRLPHQ